MNETISPINNVKVYPFYNVYNLFISHAWHYEIEYKRLKMMLNQAINFYWRNYSVILYDTFLNWRSNADKMKLQAELEIQIKNVDCVLIISDMFDLYEEWLEFEVDAAKRFSIPIIGLSPLGTEKIPKTLVNKANIIIDWDSRLLTSSIKKYVLALSSIY